MYSRLSPCGHFAITDTPLMQTRASPPPPNPPTPGETRKETTETNSRYHGLPLLRKCGHVPAPKRDISLVFSLAIADTYEYFVKNPDSHNIKNEATLQ